MTVRFLPQVYAFIYQIHSAFSSDHSTHSTSTTACWHTTHSSSHTTSHTWHSHSHHWILLLSHHHQLELFLLHMLGNVWIFVNLVLEQSSLEVFFTPVMVFEDPIVGNSANKYWHDHWILGHHISVLFFKQVKSVVVGLHHKLNNLFPSEVSWSTSSWLLHLDSQVEKLHLY